MTALERFVQGVGVVSVGLGALATVAPRRVAAVGGVRRPQADVVPLLVRLVAARQVSLGSAILTRHPVPVARSARLFLPVTALDAVAVYAGVRSGALHGRSAVMATTVLAANAAVALATRPGSWAGPGDRG